MNDSLRPMNLGGILDRAVQVYRARFLVFAELGFIHGLAQLAFQVASIHPAPNSENIGLLILSYVANFVAWIATVYFGAIVPASICLAASRANLAEGITFSEAFSTFTSKFWRLFGLSLLQGIFSGWPLLIAFVVAVFFGMSQAKLGGASVPTVSIVLLLGGIPCLALYTRYALGLPAVVVEGQTASSAIDRSSTLSEDGRWRIFWGIVVPLLPSAMLTLGTSGSLEWLKGSSALLASSPMLVAAINGIVGLISAVVFAPYGNIVLTLLYYDQRIRREGFDVERMMETAGLEESRGLPAGGEVGSDTTGG